MLAEVGSRGILRLMESQNNNDVYVLDCQDNNQIIRFQLAYRQSKYVDYHHKGYQKDFSIYLNLIGQSLKS
jgi:hypothetical protein